MPYEEREAYAEDALLLIEVAESSLAYDRSTNLRLYAAAGIPEYWVVDCVAESVEVHRTPDAGGYRDVSRVAGSGTVAVRRFSTSRRRSSRFSWRRHETTIMRKGHQNANL